MRRVKKIVHYWCNDTKTWKGDGVTVVVMDTGMASHPELQGRAILFRDFVNGRSDFYDDNGHGTHVCGVLGGRNIGIAPKCKLIVLKVLDETGNGDISYSMQGFRWIIENREKYNIRIVNISMGMKSGSNLAGEKRILKGVELLWDMGILVVTAAGNLGPKEGSITIPGLHNKVITVGASDHTHSGRGAWEKGIYKPELVAPASRIFSCNSNYQTGEMYIAKSGTSMATPIVSGAAALLLSKYPNLTNDSVKKKLQNSCVDLHMPKNWQGSGLIQIQKVLE